MSIGQPRNSPFGTPLPVSYTVPVNGLSADEAERLYWLQEECAEVIQAVAKILRHGYDSRHPGHPERGDNRAQLARELGHVDAATSLLQRAGEIAAGGIADSSRLKTIEVRQYLHHQPDALFDPT